MNCVDNLNAKARLIGATLDQSSEYTLILDAPSGYVWIASNNHSISEPCANNKCSWLSEAVKDLTAAAKMGLKKVTDDSVINSIRHDLGDNSWGADNGSPDKIEWMES